MKLEMTQTLRITKELDEAIKSVSSKIGESKQTTIRLALTIGLPLLLKQFTPNKTEPTTPTTTPDPKRAA